MSAELFCEVLPRRDGSGSQNFVPSHSPLPQGGREKSASDGTT
ncbi:hypothetical protein A2U01_0101071, partial [Trifolium medium]|nr:hypothetical protein [Trifolium medium]